MQQHDIVRYENHVPDVYVEESRDYQVLLRLFTFALNAGKIESDSLKFLNDPQNINNRFVNLLQTKVGFFTNKEFNDDAIREVLKVFKSLINLKGTRTAIEQAIKVYFQVFNLNTSYSINVINKHDTIQYEVQVGINTSIKDYSLLEEVLKYILPIGYILTIYYYKDLNYSSKYANTDYLYRYTLENEQRYAITKMGDADKHTLDATVIAESGVPIITGA